MSRRGRPPERGRCLNRVEDEVNSNWLDEESAK